MAKLEFELRLPDTKVHVCFSGAGGCFFFNLTEEYLLDSLPLA